MKGRRTQNEELFLTVPTAKLPRQTYFNGSSIGNGIHGATMNGWNIALSMGAPVKSSTMLCVMTAGLVLAGCATIVPDESIGAMGGYGYYYQPGYYDFYDPYEDLFFDDYGYYGPGFYGGLYGRGYRGFGFHGGRFGAGGGRGFFQGGVHGGLGVHGGGFHGGGFHGGGFHGGGGHMGRSR
jgi:hypothetical protein